MRGRLTALDLSLKNIANFLFVGYAALTGRWVCVMVVRLLFCDRTFLHNYLRLVITYVLSY